MDNSQKINLVHISSHYPPFVGGLEIVAKEVAENLAKDGYNVLVLTSNLHAKESLKKEINRNLVVKRLSSFNFANTTFIQTLFFHLIKVSKPAIFHLHLASAYVPEMVWLASKLRGIPYVVHFHLDVEPSGFFGTVFVLWKKIIQSRIIKDASFVIALSPNQKRMIEGRYGVKENKVVFIGNGVSDKYLDVGKEERFFDGRIKLLFVGRISVQKRPERLVQAMSMVNANCILTMVGDGEDRIKLEKMVSDLGLKNVVFKGALRGNALIEEYKNADVFILPSDREGMPLVLLEAMATGLPIIASDVLGITELIQGVGVLVKDPSPVTFAKAIDQTISDQAKLKELSSLSLKKAQSYSWVKLVKQLEDEVYEKINA